MTNKNEETEEVQRSAWGKNNGRLRPEERAPQPSNDSRVVLRSLFLDEQQIARFSFVGGKSIAKESHTARPLINRFVTSDQVTSRKCRVQTFQAREMATDERYSSSFKVKCVRRVPAGTRGGAPAAHRIVRLSRFGLSGCGLINATGRQICVF